MKTKCPECNREIDDMVPECPYCGYPFEDMNSCLDCGEEISKDAYASEIEVTASDNNSRNNKNIIKSNKKISKIWIVAAGLIVILVLLFIIKSWAKCEHEYDEGIITKEATCTEEGVKTFTCKLCGEDKAETVPFAEHRYDSGKVTKEATCNEEGEKTLTCQICGNEKVETIKIKDHDYEEEITKEATFTEEGEKTFTCKNCGDSYTESIPVRDDKIIFTVEDKINYEKDTSAWRFMPFVELVCKIENMTDKDIKGVEGELTVNDLFGKQIIIIDWDITGEDIPANGFIIQKDYGLEINEFMDTHMKLYNTDYDDLKFEYKVKQIAYTDGTTESS